MFAAGGIGVSEMISGTIYVRILARFLSHSPSSTWSNSVSMYRLFCDKSCNYYYIFVHMVASKVRSYMDFARGDPRSGKKIENSSSEPEKFKILI